jgi:hypothetical protein
MAKRRREAVADVLPDRLSIPTVRAAAQGCRACDRWKRSTQTVFGEGPKKAALMLVGEQPGDPEDLGPRCIPRLCCAPPTMRRGSAKPSGSSRICAR